MIAKRVYASAGYNQGRERTIMTTKDDGRRHFLRQAGVSLFAAGAATGLGLGAARAGHHEAMTQTRESQAAMTPQKALQMLKDGNARFAKGQMLKRDYLAFAGRPDLGQVVALQHLTLGEAGVALLQLL